MGLGSGKSGSLESNTEVCKLKVYTEIRYLLQLRFGIIGAAGGIFSEIGIAACPLAKPYWTKTGCWLEFTLLIS